MRKIEKSLNLHLPSVKLFREDIDEIAEILKEKCEKVVFIHGDYEYDSLDDIVNKIGTKISSFEIQSSRPYVSIKFKRDIWGVFLYVSESQDLFYRLKDFLTSKRKFLSKLFTFPLGLSLLIFGIITAFSPNLFSLVGIPIGIFSPFFLILGIISLLYRLGTFYKITFESKYKRQTFFSRKKDEIILLILGAVIGSIITLFASYLFGNKN